MTVAFRRSHMLAVPYPRRRALDVPVPNAAVQRQVPRTAPIALANGNHHGAPRGKIPIAAAPWRSAVSCKMVSVTAVLYKLTPR
jgi:hypothetical protein